MFSVNENMKHKYPNSCAIRCQQLILQDYGFDIEEDELCNIAKKNGWYREDEGIFMHNNGKLLEYFGLKYYHKQHNTIADICKEIELRHRVIVNVNPDKLHFAPSESFRYHIASHCIIINKVDLKNNVILITDPMTDNVEEPCSIDWFIHSWADSIYYMLATEMAL